MKEEQQERQKIRLKKQGDRLRIALKCRKKKQSDIYNKYLTQYDLASRKAIFSDYVHGKRDIPIDLLVDITKELNTPLGYLQGIDGFNIESDNLEDNIRQYNRIIAQKNVINSAPDKYMFLFDIIFERTGLVFSISTNVDDSEIVYALYDLKNKSTKHYSPDDMEQLFNQICEYTYEQNNHFVSIYDEDKYEPGKNDIEKIKQYRKEANKLTASNKVKKGVKK